MNALELVSQVEQCEKAGWINSDLWPESEEILKKMAAHYRVCEKCREAFDTQDYPEETLIAFEKRLGTTKLEDWICNEVQ